MTEISIIVPVYNSVKYLERSLSSILTQSFPDFEIIAVDDGSTDGSWELMKQFALNDSRVKIFHKENGGVSSARNFGLTKAMGKYICFVDSDDELMGDALKIMVDMTGGGIDLVMGGYEMYDEKGEITYSITERIEKTVSRVDAIKQMYKPDYYIYWGFIWGKLFRRTIIDKYNLHFDEDIYYTEDRLFAIEYLSRQNGFVLLFTKPVYKYITRPCGAMSSMRTSFNPKTVTGFTAMIRMKKVIKEYFPGSDLLYFADDGIFESYSYIHNKMEEYGGVVKSIHWKLLAGLIRALPFSYLVRKKLTSK